MTTHTASSRLYHQLRIEQHAMQLHAGLSVLMDLHRRYPHQMPRHEPRAIRALVSLGV